MSDDELEKLAAAMKNISPSKAARERGMEAAMAAFDTEFASERTAVTETAEEKTSATPQGLSDAPRPTGQTTYAGYVGALGRDAMSKVKEFFTAPKAMMMMGTCAAALFATSLYIPNTRFEEMPKSAPQAVTADVGESSEVDKTVGAKDSEASSDVEAFSDTKASEPSGTVAPKNVQPAIATPATMESESKVDNMGVDKRPTIRLGTGGATIEDPRIKTADVGVDVTERPETIIAAPSETVTTETIKPETPSNVVTIERRILKSPARTMERVIPVIPKTVTRRRVKTPARTVERAVPAVTKQETRRVEKADGTFETVSETVVVQEAATELVTIPPTYETYTETVVVQEASSELVTVPPVYETVRETVKINADGSSEVLNSETIGTDKAASSPATGGISSVSRLFTKIGPSEDASSPHVAKFGTRAESGDALSDGFTATAPTPAPAPEAIASPESSADFDEVVVTGAKRAKSFSRRKKDSRRSRRETAALEIAPIESPPGNPMPPALLAEFAAEPKIPATSRIVERAIPAVTKTRTRRVVKTPASTQERVIPAITKDVTVQVLTEDGTYKEVTKTFIIQPATTELVTIPATFETVAETVMDESPRTERFVLHEDGTMEPWPPVIKPKPQPKPQSGLLTAGDYDDVLNPDLYKVYLDKMLQGPLKRKNLPYVDANNRINIRVVDNAGQPIPLADVTMRTRNNNKMFPLRTGADGMAYLYPEFDGLERGVRLRISVNDGKAVRKTISSKMVRKGGNIEVVLDTQTAPKKNLDLLLTIDATGSMGDEMRYLQTELEAIVGRVERANPGIDIRTGLVVYRDVGDDYVVREVPFTDDLEKFREALNAQNADGGGNMPEAMHTALQTGLDMDWRKDAVKINLLVADAPPHDRHIDETWEAGLKSRTRGIHIVPLAASGVDKTAEFLMRSMAQITGGRYLFLTDDSGVGNPHAEPTVDCYVVTRLDGLVTRTISSLVKGERVEPQPGEVIRSVGNYRAGTCVIEEEDIPTSIQTVSSKYKQ